MDATICYTLAVYSLFDSRWVPLATSKDFDVIQGLCHQFTCCVAWPHCIVEVPNGTDDDVERELAKVDPPVFEWSEVILNLEQAGMCWTHDVFRRAHIGKLGRLN